MSALQRRRLKKQEKENAAQDRRRGKCGKSDVHAAHVPVSSAPASSSDVLSLSLLSNLVPSVGRQNEHQLSGCIILVMATDC